MKDRRHAFWQTVRGPENLKGEALHAIQGNDESLAHYSEGADESRLLRLQEMYGGEGFHYPRLGWWVSQEAFEYGLTGFGGDTKESIYRDHPELKIHESLKEAANAAGY